MTVSFATFDRFKTKGVAAYKNGDYLAAKSYLTGAAECMIEDARCPHLKLAELCNTWSP